MGKKKIKTCMKRLYIDSQELNKLIKQNKYLLAKINRWFSLDTTKLEFDKEYGYHLEQHRLRLIRKS